MQLIQTNSVLKLADFIATKKGISGLTDSIERLNDGAIHQAAFAFENERLISTIENSGLFIANQIFYQALPLDVKVEKEKTAKEKSAVENFTPTHMNMEVSYHKLQRDVVSGNTDFAATAKDTPVLFKPDEDFHPQQLIIATIQLKSYYGNRGKRHPIGWTLEQAAHDFIHIIFGRDFYILEEVSRDYCNVYLIMTFDDMQNVARICNEQELLINHIMNRRN